MFGLIRILLLLVIIAAVALLIRPDLIQMTGLPGSKPPQSKDTTVSAPTPVAVPQSPETATTNETDAPKAVEQAVEQTAEKTAITESATPGETVTPQQSDTTAESDLPQQETPGHDPETLKQSDSEWGFDSSQETARDADNATPDASDTLQESGTATETVTPQESAPAHAPETLKQSDAEWGFDSSAEAPRDADNTPPEEPATPQESDTGSTETQDEAALRKEVEELLELAADIIDNPDQK